MLIEHDMRVVFHLADRISVLAEGKLLAEGTPTRSPTDGSAERLSGESRMNALEALEARLNTFYGKSHILHDVALAARRAASRRCSAATAPARPRPCAASWG